MFSFGGQGGQGGGFSMGGGQGGGGMSMQQPLMGAITGAIRGNREAKDGQGFYHLGNGLMAYNPGDAMKKVEGTVGGAIEGFIGGGGGGGQGGGGMLDQMKQQKEQQKQTQQKAKLMDSGFELFQQSGVIESDVDANDLSVNQKADMYDGAVNKMKLMQQMEDLAAKRRQNSRRDLRSTGAGLFDVDSGSIIPGTGPTQNQPVYPYREGMPSVVRLDDNTLGILDNKIRGYNPQRPRTMRGEMGEDVVEDISIFPDYRTWGQKPAPDAAPAQKLNTQDQQALEWARANPNDPRAKAILQRLGAQ